jgi:hypothetical protein
LNVISVCTRPGQHVTDRIGPYQPQVPGAEFGLGVRWRLTLTSIGVPGLARARTVTRIMVSLIIVHCAHVRMYTD